MHSLTRHAATASRLVLGLVFFVFGLNGFLGFIPPPPLPAPAVGFMGALAATGYMIPFIKGTEVLVGALLLTHRFVPLALTVAAPVILHIAAFHVVLAPVNLGMVGVLLVTELHLAWVYRDAFQGVLAARAAPRVASAPGPRHEGLERAHA